MLEDLFNITQKVTINNKEYSLEYNHKSYAVLESVTGKGLFKLKDLFVNQNNLTFEDSIEIICCACLIHHKTDEIELLRKYLRENLGIFSLISQPVLYAFLSPLMPPEIMEKFQDELKENTSKKK